MFPILDCSKLDKNFDGDLYFFFSQGLGDTVKGLRFVEVIRNLFPKSRLVIFCDKRWSDIIPQIPEVQVHWYSDGIDISNPEKGKSSSITKIKKMICNSPKFRSTKSFVAFEPIALPDQFSKGESDVEVMARLIDLEISKEDLRAYIPPSAIDHVSTDLFLAENQLLNKEYIVFSPHTWSVKDWGIDNFLSLAKRLQSDSRINILVLGLKGLGEIPLPGVIHGLSLPLRTVIGLIAKSSLLFGNDSGLAHIASAFNFPVVVIYKNREDLPFCIKVQSHFSVLFLGKDYFGSRLSREKEVETLHSIIVSCMKGPNFFNKPQCPACHNIMEFMFNDSVLGNLWNICHCGSGLQTHEQVWISGESPLVQFENFLKSFLSACKTGERQIIKVSDNYKSICIPNTGEKFFLSFDGLVKYVTRKGFSVISIQKNNGQNDVRTLEVKISPVISKCHLKIPWGRRALNTDQDFYCRFFAWRTWAIPLRWRGLPKMAMKQSDPFLGYQLASTLFRTDPNMKLLRYSIQALLGIFKESFRTLLLKVIQ